MKDPVRLYDLESDVLFSGCRTWILDTGRTDAQV